MSEVLPPNQVAPSEKDMRSVGGEDEGTVRLTCDASEKLTAIGAG